MKKSLTLKDTYEIAYGKGELPFQNKHNACDFLITSLISDLIIANEEKKLSIWDTYFYLLDKAGVSIGNFYQYLAYELKDFNIDKFLYERFYDNEIFEHTLEYSDYMLEQLGVNLEDCVEEDTNYIGGFFPMLLGKEVLSDITKDIKQKYELSEIVEKPYTSNIIKFLDILFDDYSDARRAMLLKTFIDSLKINTSIIINLRQKVLNESPKELIERIKSALIKPLDNEEVKKTEQFITRKKSENKSEKETEKVETVQFDPKKLENVEQIENRVIGQEFALAKIQNAILCSSVGFKNEKQPIASFLLTGPTGVGKTETAKAVAKACFDDKFFVVDMSTFKNDIDVSRLLGGSPNYVGYNDPPAFCEFLKENPCSVILFDEIEKAHKSCLDLLMRILDEGEFINAKNEKISMKDTVIFCTTNLTQNKPKTVGFNKEGTKVEQEVVGNVGIRRELAGRFTEIIEYRQLSKESCKKIAKDIFLKDIVENFEKNNQNGLTIKCTDDFLDLVVECADTNLFGARDINKSLKSNLVGPVSKYILKNRPTDSTLIISSNGIRTYRKKQKENKIKNQQEQTAMKPYKEVENNK